MEIGPLWKGFNFELSEHVFEEGCGKCDFLKQYLHCDEFLTLYYILVFTEIKGYKFSCAFYGRCELYKQNITE